MTPYLLGPPPTVEATFITKSHLPDGSLLAEPILTPSFRLVPLNAVAEATADAELLRCKAEVKDLGRPEVSVMLRCEEAEFELAGVWFQK